MTLRRRREATSLYYRAAQFHGVSRIWREMRWISRCVGGTHDEAFCYYWSFLYYISGSGEMDTSINWPSFRPSTEKLSEKSRNVHLEASNG